MITQDIYDRITEQRQMLGISEAELCRRAEIHNKSVQNIRNGMKPGPDKLARLAKALDVSVDYLISGNPLHGHADTSTIIPVAMEPPLSIVGEVQAGHWLEAAEWDESSQGAVNIPVSPQYARMRQFALRVRGDSMNKVFPDGTYLACVSVFDLGEDPGHGDYVIVHRTRGGFTEATVKQLEITPDGGWKLWPRSDHQDFQTPLEMKPLESDDDVIRITAVVVGLSRMIERARPIRPATKPPIRLIQP